MDEKWLDPELTESEPDEDASDQEEVPVEEEDEDPPQHHIAMHGAHSKWMARHQSLIPLLAQDLEHLQGQLKTAPPEDQERITDLIARLQQALMEATKGTPGFPGPAYDEAAPEQEEGEATDGNS